MIASLSKYEMCFSYYYNTQFCFVRQNKINISFGRSKRPFLSDKYTKKPLKPKIFRFSNFIDFHTYIVKQPDFSLISSSCTPCFRHFSSARKAFLRAFSFRHFFFLEVIYIRWNPHNHGNYYSYMTEKNFFKKHTKNTCFLSLISLYLP